ncbi:hypothetical protein ACRAWB_16520 [Leifsonia poae]|uniref:hypothetical protein n=1 Tax=Leifsonia poae TaxID=110933 RepID=UPI003D68ADD6
MTTTSPSSALPLRRLREATAETLALTAAAAAFVPAGVVALIVFLTGDHQLAIAYVGMFAAIAAGIVAVLAYGAGRFVVLRSESIGPAISHRSRASLGFAVFDTVAIGIAHGAIVWFVTVLSSEILASSFAGAPVYAPEAAVIVGCAGALAAYSAFSSAVRMSTTLLSVVLALFLVFGTTTAMLTASNKEWWKMNLSSLGTVWDISGIAFNATLIFSGIMVAAIARQATAPADPARALTRGDSTVRWTLVVVGFFLACVGLVPVNVSIPIHNTVATGMAVVFCALVVALKWLMPTLPMAFIGLGWTFLVVIAACGGLFALGYYNLTAVELVAAVAIFSWIIVFLRVVGARQADAEAKLAPASA